MIKLGYTLSSEEFDPITLVKNARLAEEAGFDFLGISDHFHPWVDEQGQSPFVWNVIGALSEATQNVQVFIEVNCPILRYHPAIVAQAAATSQVQLKGRFILGVGTGENLNEHVIGRGWPPISVRQEMLAEAIKIIRQLWQGGYQTYWGKFFNLDAGRIYTLPKQPVLIIISAMGAKSAQIAGELGDGLVTTKPQPELVKTFLDTGGKNKPIFGQMSLCFDQSEQKAQEIMVKEWPLAGMPKPLNTELRLPKDFESTAKLVRPEDATKDVPLGANAEAIIQAIQKYIKAGFDHLYIHNIGPNQEQFIEFARTEILPKLRVKADYQINKKITEPNQPSPTFGYAHQIKKP
jgi:G6PDH family F420-dependent oxidoreductase